MKEHDFGNEIDREDIIGARRRHPSLHPTHLPLPGAFFLSSILCFFTRDRDQCPIGQFVWDYLSEIPFHSLGLPSTGPWNFFAFFPYILICLGIFQGLIIKWTFCILPIVASVCLYVKQLKILTKSGPCMEHKCYKWWGMSGRMLPKIVSPHDTIKWKQLISLGNILTFSLWVKIIIFLGYRTLQSYKVG